jgi:hypothetical protein
MVFERNLFASGERGSMLDAKGNARAAGSHLGLDGLLRSLNVDVPCQLHNAGNDAFMTLFALQKLFEPETPLPTMKHRGTGGMMPSMPMNGNLLPVPIPRPIAMQRHSMQGVPTVSMSRLSVAEPALVAARSSSAPQFEGYLTAQNGHLEEDSSQVRRSRISMKPGRGRAM